MNYEGDRMTNSNSAGNAIAFMGQAIAKIEEKHGDLLESDPDAQRMLSSLKRWQQEELLLATKEMEKLSAIAREMMKQW